MNKNLFEIKTIEKVSSNAENRRFIVGNICDYLRVICENLRSRRVFQQSQIRAAAMTEITLLIVAAVLVITLAQPRVYRAIQGLYRRQIDQLREPPSFEMAVAEADKYVHPASAGYDIFAEHWDSTLTDHFESTNQTVNAGNTTMTFYRRARFIGDQSEPSAEYDDERINLE